MMLQENTVVADRFRLIRMIGRGGMGSVWQAHDTRLDIACAVKFIEGELANVAEAHQRFEREAKAAAALRSPHVVEIKDHGVWQGTPYIAMELLDGEDLGKLIARSGGKLSPAQVNVVIEQVCRALTKAHQAGIVHRDLKPDNIFIVNDDDRQLVKILDFGVAKSATGTIDGSNTKTGAMLGTPYYMSPEQAQGIKSVDARSDLWSLAVIVYQCITGRLPFESEALGDLLVKIIVQPVPVPSQVAVVPPGFDKWWAKAAERNPDARFPTAKEFAASLSLALGTSTLSEHASSPNLLAGTAVMSGGGAPAATPNPYGQPTPNPAYRTPPPGMPTPGPVVMTPPSFSPNTPPPNQATFSGVEPPISIPKKGPPVGIIVGALVALLVVGGAGAFVATKRGSAASGGTATATATAATTTAPSASASAATSAATAEPATTDKPSTPEPTASASAQPTGTASAAPSGDHGGAKPTVAGGGATTAAPNPTAATASAAKPPTTPAKPPAPAGKKKLDLGF